MSCYQHILLAVDYSGHDQQVGARAKELASQYQAKLSILHVLDDVPLPDTGYGTIISLDQQSLNGALGDAKESLLKIAAELDVEQCDCWMVWGKPNQEIETMAEKISADLIVVGSHGRHGLALLLGSTANSVLHHAQCDVLAVRLQD